MKVGETMQYLSPMYFDESIATEIKEVLNIDINEEEYSETECSVEYIDESKDLNEPYYVNTKGTIFINREGFPLYIISYEYSYNEKNFTDDCQIKIREKFPEYLEHFGLPDIH